MSHPAPSRICNVFSLEEKTDKALGTVTIRQFIKKSYWFVEQDDKGNMTIQPIGENNIPIGLKNSISMQQLQQYYIPEPQFYYQKVYPKLHAMENAVRSGDNYLSKKENFSAELEYNVALRIDETNIRANFGTGIILLSRGETGKASTVFKRLVQMNGTFQKEHKHLFNEFGISLRKNNMHKHAVEYYERALRLSNQDENLHVNIARPLFATGQLAACTEHLFEALRLAPTHAMALRFLLWLSKGGYIPKELQEKTQTLLTNGPSADGLPVNLCHPESFVLPEELLNDELLNDVLLEDELLNDGLLDNEELEDVLPNDILPDELFKIRVPVPQTKPRSA